MVSGDYLAFSHEIRGPFINPARILSDVSRVNVPLSREQIASVFSFHPSIRFVVVVDRKGTVLDAVRRARLESLEPPEETGRIVERWTIARGMTAGTDKFFGSLKTIIVRREKLVEMLFPLSDYTVIISAHPAFPLDRTPKLEALLNKLQA